MRAAVPPVSSDTFAICIYCTLKQPIAARGECHVVQGRREEEERRGGGVGEEERRIGRERK